MAKAKKKRMKKKYSDDQLLRLSRLVDPNGRHKLKMKDAIKLVNKDFPRNKFPNVSAGHQALHNQRKRNGKTNGGATREDIVNEALALRKKNNWSFYVIAEELVKKYGKSKVPHPSSLAKHARDQQTNGHKAATNGKPVLAVGDLKIFKSTTKGKLLVEMPKDRATKLALEEANL